MNKPAQYLLVGFPYSGKTTLGKLLAEKLNFAHINLDQLKWDMGYSDVGDDDVPDTVWDKVFNDADNLLIKYLNEGKNVANEYAWITREWRDRARGVAKGDGFETIVIYLKLSRDVIINRWKENEKSRKRFQWPEDEFNRTFSEFEEPTSDENVIIYDGTMSLEEWVCDNFNN